MFAVEASKRLFSNLTQEYVVETQRTRGGTDKATGSATRPYRFGEFDILAVAMHPSTGDWSRFMYTVERWLIPDPTDSTQLFKYQPVTHKPNGFWTDDLAKCISWLRSGDQKRLPTGNLIPTVPETSPA